MQDSIFWQQDSGTTSHKFLVTCADGPDKIMVQPDGLKVVKGGVFRGLAG
jgi:hypothetical protein